MKILIFKSNTKNHKFESKNNTNSILIQFLLKITNLSQKIMKMLILNQFFFIKNYKSKLKNNENVNFEPIFIKSQI